MNEEVGVDRGQDEHRGEEDINAVSHACVHGWKSFSDDKCPQPDYIQARLSEDSILANTGVKESGKNLPDIAAHGPAMARTDVGKISLLIIQGS